MLVIKGLRERKHAFIKPFVATLVAADEENGATPGVKSIEDPDRTTATLDTQLPNVTMS